MSRKDGVLALLVVVVWGLNFVVIKVGLHNMPPLMLAGLRFMLVAFPAIFFVARPKVPLNLLLGYGLTISFAQFAFLFVPLTSVCLLDWLRWCYRHRRFYYRAWRVYFRGAIAWQTIGGDRLSDFWRTGVNRR